MSSLSGPGRPQATGTTVITFYAGAPGSACTTSLANVAWILASAGRDVLVVDWNLDDPGLAQLFRPVLPSDGTVAEATGIADVVDALVGDLATPASGADLATIAARHACLERHAVALGWSEVQGLPAGRLHMVGPGRLDADRPRKVKRHDDAGDLAGAGPAFAEALRKHVSAAGYDYVLFDAPTGSARAGHLCTTALADVTVVCFPLNEPAIERAAAAAETILRGAQRPLRVVPLPTKVDLDLPSDDLDSLLDSASRRFASVLSDLSPAERAERWTELMVPRRRYYETKEVLAAFVESRRAVMTILTAYERLTDELTSGDVTQLDPHSDEQHRQIRERLRAGARPAAEAVCLFADPRDRAWADWVRDQLTWAGIRVRQSTGAELAKADGVGTDTPVVVLSSNLAHTELGATVAGLRYAAPAGQGSPAKPVGVRVAEGYLVPPLAGMAEVDLVLRDEQDARAQLIARFQPRFSRPPGDGPSRGARYPDRVPDHTNLRPRNYDFVGRGPLFDTMRDILGTSTADTPPIVLVGSPGAGKSEVAAEYAWRFRADYDVVWWVPSQGWLAGDSLTTLARRLGTPVGVRADDTVAALFERLRRGRPPETETRPDPPPRERWLLVYDGAGEPGDIEPLLPRVGRGHVIVTSRAQEWSAQEQHVFRVDALAPQEAVGLLQRRIHNLPTPAAEELAERLGYHAMALRHASGWLLARRDSGLDKDPAGEYLRLLRDEASKAQDVGPEDSPGVRVAAALSVTELGAPVNRASLRLLQLCAHLSPAGIGMDLLRSPAVQRDLEAQGPDATWHFGQALHRLARSSLVHVDGPADVLFIDVVTQEVVRALMSPDERSAVRAAAQDMLGAYAPPDVEMDAAAHDARYVELSRHIEPAGAAAAGAVEVRRWLVNQVRYHYRKDELARARELGDDLIARWTADFGEDDPLRLRLATQLANAYRPIGAYQRAAELVAPTLERQRALLGIAHPITLMTQRSHGGDLRAAGQFEDAFALDQATYKGYTASLGDSHPDTLMEGHNLALSLALRGSWEEALALAGEVFRIRLGNAPEDGRTWSTGAAIASYHRQAGQFETAARTAARCHERLRTLEGPDADSTLHAAVEVAASARCLGRSRVALVEAQRSWAGLHRRHGDEHPETIIAATELAACQMAIGDPRSALERGEIALRACQALLGDHPFTEVLRADVGSFHLGVGDVETAAKLTAQAVDALRDHGHVGPGHPFTWTAARAAATAFVAAGDLPRALALDQEAARGYTGLGVDDPSPWSTDALVALEDSLARLRGTISPHEPTTSRPPAHGEIFAI